MDVFAASHLVSSPEGGGGMVPINKNNWCQESMMLNEFNVFRYV